MEPAGAHGEFRMAGPTHELGYEPDTFSVKTILAVPIAVLITGVIAFVVTGLLFANIFDPRIQYEPPDYREAAAQNDQPLNERLARMSSSDPNAPIQQPRLEGMEQRKTSEPGQESDLKLTPEITTTQPLKERNPPRYHADDLRPENQKVLTSGGDGPNGTEHIPIDRAMAELINRNLLPVRDGARPLAVEPAWDRPKDSNGGTGRLVEAPKKAPAKKQPDGKDGEPKKK
jgi:hypothetical protein